jgi:hypothetical protein
MVPGKYTLNIISAGFLIHTGIEYGTLSGERGMVAGMVDVYLGQLYTIWRKI